MTINISNILAQLNTKMTSDVNATEIETSSGFGDTGLETKASQG